MANKIFDVYTWASGDGTWNAMVQFLQMPNGASTVSHPDDVVKLKAGAKRAASKAIRAELEQRGELGAGYRLRLDIREIVMTHGIATGIVYTEA